MKANTFFKSLGIFSASTLLVLAAAGAKPDENSSKDASPSQKADPSTDKKDDKGDQKDHQPGKQKDTKKDQGDKQEDKGKPDGKPDRGPDNKNPDGDSKNDKEERADDRQADVRPDEKRRGEFKGRFEDRDRGHVVTYFEKYKGNNRGLPPGLARKWDSGRRLPAGWRDRLVTGYVIQDDWYPAFEPVPYSWFPGIAVVPDTRLYWYGDRVVRVYEPSREVVDVVIIPTIHIDL